LLKKYGWHADGHYLKDFRWRCPRTLNSPITVSEFSGFLNVRVTLARQDFTVQQRFCAAAAPLIGSTVMQHTLIAVFDHRADAQSAPDALRAAGFARTDIRADESAAAIAEPRGVVPVGRSGRVT
jgi:hypothetical protein